MRRKTKDGRLSSMVAQAVEHVDIERIRADIETLCRSPRNSAIDPASHRQAAQYVAEELREAGCSVSRQEFTVPSEPQQRPGQNVVGVLGAAMPETQSGIPTGLPSVLVGAHYDTVPGSPGADDNASGVAVMLECARVLSMVERNRPLLFVGFDAEERQPEVGLHGSGAFVRELKASTHAPKISAAYILEMVGFSAPAGQQKVPRGLQLVFPRAFDRLASSRFSGDSVVAVSNWKSRAAARLFEDSARFLSNGVPVLPVEVPRWLPAPRNLKRSDHAPFWDAGIPAVMIGDTANFRNPNYHAESDTPDTLDYEFMDRVARTLVATVTRQVMVEAPRRRRKVRLR